MAVIGYRAWELNYEEESLLPCVMYSAGAWERQGRTGARCVQRYAFVGHEPELAPVHSCGCGLYAHADFEGLQYHEGMWASVHYIAGAVVCWGSITAHGNGRFLEGFRAKWAQPIVLLQSPLIETQPVINRIAARIGASVVSTPEQLVAQTSDWRHIKEAVDWKPSSYVDQWSHREQWVQVPGRYHVRFVYSTGTGTTYHVSGSE